MELYEFVDPNSGNKITLNVNVIAAVQLPDKGRVVNVIFSESGKITLSCGTEERAAEEYMKIRAALADAGAKPNP